MFVGPGHYAFMPLFEKKKAIDGDVDGQHQKAKKYLALPGQSRRVDQGDDVVIDKAVVLEVMSRGLAKMVLKGGQGAGPAL